MAASADVESILFLLPGGLPRRMLPPCFPPVSTVRRWFHLWRDNRLIERISLDRIAVHWDRIVTELDLAA